MVENVAEAISSKITAFGPDCLEPLPSTSDRPSVDGFSLTQGDRCTFRGNPVSFRIIQYLSHTTHTRSRTRKREVTGREKDKALLIIIMVGTVGLGCTVAALRNSKSIASHAVFYYGVVKAGLAIGASYAGACTKGSTGFDKESYHRLRTNVTFGGVTVRSLPKKVMKWVMAQEASLRRATATTDIELQVVHRLPRLGAVMELDVVACNLELAEEQIDETTDYQQGDTALNDTEGNQTTMETRTETPTVIIPVPLPGVDSDPSAVVTFAEPIAEPGESLDSEANLPSKTGSDVLFSADDEDGEDDVKKDEA